MLFVVQIMNATCNMYINAQAERINSIVIRKKGSNPATSAAVLYWRVREVAASPGACRSQLNNRIHDVQQERNMCAYTAGK